ncbi:DUF4214 domain-containing protein [Noviherbaspirillum malthae]|uniref:DUF4214 domain-containing protein n=1 Tax=Noviherbaspirillum malthae TaxID=1260987 RepID=UPI00188DDB2E|nr:DUF4214 domain-containing protein [Noviherbaspirillum malthae]
MAVEVNTRTTYPYTAVSLIVVTFPDGHKVAGTGTMVGPNDLLTAAHVVYSPDHGGWASALSLYPGADFNGTTGRIEDAPYVVENFRWQLDGWPAQAFSDDSNATFRYEESQYDVAVIGLSKAIGMQTGWFALARGYNTAQWASVLGYASGTTGLMSGKAWVTRETSTSLYAASAGPGTDLLGSGSSGGPLYVIDGNGLPSIIGVKSAGTASTNIWADIDLLHDRLLAAMSRNDALIDGAYRCKNIPDADATAGRLFSLALAADTFKSGNAGGHLAYTATLADGSALPSWLKFDAATKAFSGTPASTDSTGMSVRVTARAADGSSASDEFRISVGSAGIDYTGTPGSDRIAAQTGNDMIDGGSGIDTVVFAGKRAAYQISTGEWGIAVKDTTGTGGADSLVNIERLQFADKTIAFDTGGNAGQAYRLYQAAFNRTPDTGGLSFQTRALDAGWSLSDIARNFIDSPEFSARYGMLTPAEFVTRLYANVLLRAPEAEGLAFHLNNLANGMSWAQTLAGFSESPENQAALIGVIQNGMELIV